MAVALVDIGTVGYASAGSSSPYTYTGLTVSAGISNSVAIFCAALGQGTTTAISGFSATWGGSPCTIIGSVTDSNTMTSLIIGIVNPASGNQNLVLSWTAGTVGELTICGSTYSGVVQTGGTATFAHYNSSLNANTATLSVAITTAVGNLTTGFASTGQSPTMTAPVGFTPVFSKTNALSTFSVQGAFVSTSGSTTWTATQSPSDTIEIQGVDLVAAPTAPAVAVTLGITPGIAPPRIFAPSQRYNRGLRQTTAYPAAIPKTTPFGTQWDSQGAVSYQLSPNGIEQDNSLTVNNHGNMAVVYILLCGAGNLTLSGILSSMVAHWDPDGANQSMYMITNFTDSNGGSDVGVIAFGLTNPSLGSKKFSVTWTGSMSWIINMGFAFSGVNQTGGATTFNHFSTKGTVSAQSLVSSNPCTTTPNDLVVGGGCVINGAQTFSSITGITAGTKYNPGTNTNGAGFFNWAAAQAATFTCSGNAVVSDFSAGIAVNVKGINIVSLSASSLARAFAYNTISTGQATQALQAWLASQTSGRNLATGVLTVTSAGAAKTFGRSSAIGFLSLAARGTKSALAARNMLTGVAAARAFLKSLLMGQSAAIGALPIRATGLAEQKGQKNQVTGALPLAARGAGQAEGRSTFVELAVLLARFLGLAKGQAAEVGTTPLRGTGLAEQKGQNRATGTLSFGAFANTQLAQTSTRLTNFIQFAARFFSMAEGRAATLVAGTLRATGLAVTKAQSRATGALAIAAQGLAEAKGRLSAYVGTVPLLARALTAGKAFNAAVGTVIVNARGAAQAKALNAVSAAVTIAAQTLAAAKAMALFSTATTFAATARGLGILTGRAGPTSTTTLAARTIGELKGQAAFVQSLALRAYEVAQAKGRSAATGAASVAARAFNAAKGQSALVGAMVVLARGFAAAKAQAAAIGAATFRAFGTTQATGRLTPTGAVSIAARGLGAAYGQAKAILTGANLFFARMVAMAKGSLAPPTGALPISARGTAQAKGVVAFNGLLSFAARTLGMAKGQAVFIQAAFLLARALTAAKGRAASVEALALQAFDIAEAKAYSRATGVTSLAARAFNTAKGQSAFVNAVFLAARAFGAATGRLTVVASNFSLALAGRVLAAAKSLSSITESAQVIAMFAAAAAMFKAVPQPGGKIVFAARGVAQTKSYASLASLFNLFARGTSAAFGRLAVAAGNFKEALFATGTSQAEGRAQSSGKVFIRAIGKAMATGASVLVPAFVMLALGAAKSFGRSTTRAVSSLTALFTGQQKSQAATRNVLTLTVTGKAAGSGQLQLLVYANLVAVSTRGKAAAFGRGLLTAVSPLRALIGLGRSALFGRAVPPTIILPPTLVTDPRYITTPIVIPPGSGLCGNQPPC